MPPEQNARQQIAAMLIACGVIVQNFRAVEFSAGRGIALREVTLKTGPSDYLLLVDRGAVGAIEVQGFSGHGGGYVEQRTILVPRPSLFGAPEHSYE
jgi:type I restriction enzyme R subunit